jgi:hypothetical protein
MSDETLMFWSPVDDDAALAGYEGAHGEWRPAVRGFAREAGTQDGEPDLDDR